MGYLGEKQVAEFWEPEEEQPIPIVLGLGEIKKIGYTDHHRNSIPLNTGISFQPFVSYLYS